MPDFSAPLKEVSRMLDLVPYLSTHPYISIAELASEFNISEKEMARELTTLSMCGLPGYTPLELIEVFFESGYVTINNHDSLDIPRALSFTEIATLLLGLELLRDSLEGQLPDIFEEISSLIEQLSRLVGGAVSAESEPSISAISDINRAIASRSALLIRYNSTSSDRISTREIEPLEITESDGRTYLRAYCRSSQAFRSFRADRIEILEQLGPVMTEHHLAPPDGATVIDIEILGNRRALSEVLGLPELGNSPMVSIPIFSTDWLIRNVFAAAGQMQVLNDAQLRSDIRLTAAKVLALYR